MATAISALPSEPVLGSVEPRLFTPPLRELTPDTSYGFDVIDFAEEIGYPFRPWQQTAVIRAGELLPDGRPRFRVVLIIVARQNGKTLLIRIVTLYWMFIERVPLVLGTSTDRFKAKQTWRHVIHTAEGNEILARELPRVHVREQLGEEDFWTTAGAHYRFSAPNRRAGRGDTVHRAVLDEIREHQTFDTYDAVHGAMTAVRHAQLWCISNQGDRRGVVLKSLRTAALGYITTGVGDRRLGLLEWSAPEGSRPTDLHALAQANPDLGRDEIDPEALLGQALRAELAGGDELDSFKIEHMCIGVELLDPGIDLAAWTACGPTDEAPAVDLAEHRQRLALCVDVAMDGKHATLAAAAVVDGLVHVEIVATWTSTALLRAGLPGWVERLWPRTLAWFPSGPTAAVMVALEHPTRGVTPGKRWPPRRVTLNPIKSETTAVCMGFAEQVDTAELRHNADPVAIAHVSNAIRAPRGDAWVFARRGAGHVDALYAMAGAVHEARRLPAPRTPLKSVPNSA
jgi:hypothetical protein